MPAIVSKRQWLDPQDTGDRKLAIKMREQCPVPGWLPSQCRTQAIGIDGNEQQIGHTGKMPRRRLLDLVRGREMDVAVTHVDPGAPKRSGRLRVPPQGGVADLVDGARHAPVPNPACCGPPPHIRNRVDPPARPPIRTITVQPAVQITNPPAGSAVKGTVSINASVTGAVGDSNTFTFLVDSTVLSTQTTKGTTASTNWNTKHQSAGTHTLTVSVTDADNFDPNAATGSTSEQVKVKR